MRPLLLFLIHGLGTLAFATSTPTCLVSFATAASSDPNGEALVATTYRDLIERIGTGLSSKTLRDMQAGGNPFEVPDEPGRDRHAIQRRLKEFEMMVDAKEWKIPSTILRLLRDLGQMAERIERGDNVIRQTVDKTVLETPIEFQNSGSAKVSPDGRYLVSQSDLRQAPGQTIFVYDRQTKQLREFTRPNDGVHHGTVFFGPHGDAIWFPLSNGDLKRYPFQNGVPDWTKGTVVGDGTGQFQLHQYKSAGDRHRFFVGLGDETYRVDARDNSRIRVQFPEYLGPDRAALRKFAVIPGTQRLSIISTRTESKTARLETVEFDEHGKLTPVPHTATEWKMRGDGWRGRDPENVLWSKDGKRAYLWGHQTDGSFAVIDTPGGQPRWLFEPSADPLEYRVSDLFLNPVNGDLLVLYGSGRTMKNFIEVIDGETHAAKGRFNVHDHPYEFSFSPDGRIFYAGGNNTLVAIPYSLLIGD